LERNDLGRSKKMPEETPAQLRLGQREPCQRCVLTWGHLDTTNQIMVRPVIFPPASRTAHIAAQMRLGVEEKLCMCQSMIGGTREIIPGELLEIRCVYEYAHANAEHSSTIARSWLIHQLRGSTY